jgi:hypothetical protein
MAASPWDSLSHASVSWFAEIAGLRGLWVGLNAIVLAILVLGYFPLKPPAAGAPQ